MDNLNRKVKSTITTTLNTHNKINNNNNKVSIVTNTYYIAIVVEKHSQKFNLMLYLYRLFCSEKCHVRKHKVIRTCRYG